MLHNSRTVFLATREPKSSIKKSQKEVSADPVKTKSQEEVFAEFADFVKTQCVVQNDDKYEFNKENFNKNLFGGISKKSKDEDLTKKLKYFAKEMAEFADAGSFFAVFNELIAHQVRIIQYYRLFKRFGGLNMLNEKDKKWFNKHEGEIQKALALHDSDKLKNETVVKAYLVQKYIRSHDFLEKYSADKKIMDKLAGVLRRTHSDTSKHHNEYYEYHINKKPNRNKAFEFIFDIMAIGDKKNEIIGEYYKEKHETSFGHFEKHNKLIEKVFDFFKYQKGFREIEKEKLTEQNKANEKQIEDLEKQAGTSDKVQKLKEKITSNTEQIEKIEELIKQDKEETQQGTIDIAENIEKVVWQEITSDEYGKNIELLKAVSENMLYKATEKWQQGDHKGAYDMMKNIAEIKKHVFDLNEFKKQVARLYDIEIDLANKTIDETTNKKIDEKIDVIKKENECYEGHESFFAVYEGKKMTFKKKSADCGTKKSSSTQTSCVGRC